MKKRFFQEHRGILKKIGCLALAAAVAGTGIGVYHYTQKSDIPELVTFVDPETASVTEDEVPLASGSKTTKKVQTRNSTKTVKTKQKAKKSQTTTKKSKKKSSSTKKTKTQKINTKKEIVTTVKTTVKKNSNIKKINTKVVTTTITTTQTIKTASSGAASSTSASSSSSSQAGTYSIRSVAPLCDSRVLSAWEKMGGKIVVDPKVSYAGSFNASKRTITLRRMSSTIYHEIGHFVEFAGGTSPVKKQIAAAYAAEKSKYTASNKAYVLQNSSEYFAESFKNYCENPGALKSARPQTYEVIVQALNNITDSRMNSLIAVYSSVWK